MSLQVMGMADDTTNASQLTEQAAGDSETDPESAGSPAVRPPESRRRIFRIGIIWFVAGLILGALAADIARRLAAPSPSTAPLMRFDMALPAEAPLDLKAKPMAFAADGTQLVYVARRDDDTQLYLRALGRIAPEAVPGTVNAYTPFFSPAGTSIGYFDADDARLKTIPTQGGKPSSLCRAPFGVGACWCRDDFIIFSPDSFSGLWRIPAAGGTPEPLTQLQENEFTHRWPEILPDNRSVLFTVGLAGRVNTMHIAALSLETGVRKMVLEGASDGRYSPTGHLLFMRGSTLMAVAFDPARLEILGTAFPVRQNIVADKAAGAGHFAVSGNGALAYAQGGEEEDLRTLVSADRSGGMEKLVVSRGAFSSPRLSPDGSRLAVAIYALDGRSKIWVTDMGTGAFLCLSPDYNGLLPTWTPDGERITFASDRDGQWNLYWIKADGSNAPERLIRGANPQLPNSWSRDGRHLVFTEFDPASGPDVWILTAGTNAVVRPFVRTSGAQWGGSFSPDGKWLAYTSDESGRNQVYVAPFPGPGEKFQISTAEGTEPVWGRETREIFYRFWKGLMCVDYMEDPAFVPGPPRMVLSGEYETCEIPVFPNYDVSADGRQFVLIPREHREKQQIRFDLNWFEPPEPAKSDRKSEGEGSPPNP